MNLNGTSLLLFFFLLLIACNKGEDIHPPTGADDGSFQFRVEDSATLHTRGVDAVFENMTVMAYHTSAGSDWSPSANNSAAALLMNQQRVDKTDGLWQYTPPKYWASTGKHTFFAFAPHGLGAIRLAPTTNAPTIEYEVPKMGINHKDLLVAWRGRDHSTGIPTLYPLANVVPKDKRDPITFYMHHALTKISFKARVATESDNDKYRIVGLGFWNVTTKAVGTFTDTKGVDGNPGSDGLYDGITWIDATDKLENITLDSQNGLLQGEPALLTTDEKGITTPNGYLYMIPQPIFSFEGESYLPQLHIVACIDDETVVPEGYRLVEQFIPLTGGFGKDWKSGEHLTYIITFQGTGVESFKLDAIVTPWNNQEVDAEVPERMLNVTRLDATVGDGSTTRVHFWSNQPQVWIDRKGYDSDNSPIHTKGNEIDPGDRFQRITWDTAKSYESYLTDSTNFHYDPTTGNGYFDVVQRRNRPEIGDNADYAAYTLLRLCATDPAHADAPFVRTVKITDKVSLFPGTGEVSTPYIGTFHRRNETGERILTWNGRGGWAAVLMNEQSQDKDGNAYNDYQHVRMDRLSSPDPNLHSEAFHDADLYPVTPYSEVLDGPITGKRQVQGFDRVYFRIGWDSPAPIGRNRYAKVKIYKITAIRPDGGYPDADLVATLFLRQGEMDDYVMRPMDPMSIGGTQQLSGRPLASLFNPYEVFGHFPGLAHNQSFNYSTLLSVGNHGGTFAPSPTIKGDYFKWGYTKGIPPLAGTIFGAGGIDSDGRNYFGWMERNGINVVYLRPQGVDGDTRFQDPCPLGYRLPSVSSVTKSINYPHAMGDLTPLANRPIVQSLMYNPMQDNTSPFDIEVLNVYSPTNPSSNLMMGFYADGFYDRGEIVPMENVSYNGDAFFRVERTYGNGSRHHHAFPGGLLFNPHSLASLFLITGGYRYTGSVTNEGNLAIFMTSTEVLDPGNAYDSNWLNGLAIISFIGKINQNVIPKLTVGLTSPPEITGLTDKVNTAFSVRCVKE